MLGWHWLVDAVDCDPERLADQAHLRAVLEGLPDALGLTRVGDVQVFAHDADGAGPAHGGVADGAAGGTGGPGQAGPTTVAGLVLIAESHFSLHARPQLGTLHGDLFSCAPFDADEALDYLRQAYGFVHFEQSYFARGKGGERS